MPDDVWDQFATPLKVRRDRWRRYLVTPPGDTEPVGYTRATTIAKVLDDQSNLIGWSARMTAFGLVDRPDLLSAFSAVDRDDRTACNKLVDRAKEAGGATVRRDQGTTLHSILERHWTEPDYIVPAIHTADVAAVDQALAAAGLTPLPEHHERIVVDDVRRIAGMPDLFVTNRTGRVRVADVKTGASIAYGQLAFAVQLAIYASADFLYQQGAATDGTEDIRTPMPDVDRDEAIIIHVEPGSGVCTLHRLDIAVGARALDLAIAVRDMRATKGILTPLDIDTPTTVRRVWIVGRVAAIVANEARTSEGWSGGELLAQQWPEGVPTFKASKDHSDDQLEQISILCDSVEAALIMPFPADTDPVIVEAARPIPGNDPTIVALQERAKALPFDLASQIQAQAGALKIPRLGHGKATAAQVEQVTDLIVWAEGQLVERAMQVAKLVTEAPVQPEVLGALLQFNLAKPTADDVDRLWALVDATACGYIAVDGTTVVATDRTDELLVKAFDSRTKALNAAKRAAKRHGCDVPTKFVDLLDDPTLIALTVGDAMHQNAADPAA